MRILMLLCCVWLAGAGTVPDKCDQVTFDGKYYDRELLIEADIAHDFSYAKSTNTMFFSYLKWRNGGLYWSVAYYNIDTKEFKDIAEVPEGHATAINTATDEVFLGGNNGIQKFNSQTKGLEPYTAEGVKIDYMYFYNILFYITDPKMEIYSYDGEESKNVSNTTIESVIGDKDEYYFTKTNETGIFRVLNGKEETAERFADEDGFRIVWARDNNKKIFVARGDGVFTPNVKDKKLDKVADIDASGFAFDKDNNIIYCDGDNIYKLTLSQAKCPPA